MDIFKSMNQTKVADFSVFKPKKKNPVTAEEQNEQNPVPQKETVAGKNSIAHKRRNSCRTG